MCHSALVWADFCVVEQRAVVDHIAVVVSERLRASPLGTRSKCPFTAWR